LKLNCQHVEEAIDLMIKALEVDPTYGPSIGHLPAVSYPILTELTESDIC
jgi:hypothetical protein